MKEAGVKCQVRMKKYKSYKGEVGKIAPNLLERDFSATEPHKKMVTDVTEFHLFGMKIYLSPVLDLYNSELIYYTIYRHPVMDMVLDMVKGTVAVIGDNTNAILHSDQGTVYASKAFNELLPMYHIDHSMSRAGTPTDNAAMEAINGWIKAELFMDFHVTGEKPVCQEIDDYIQFFNEQRPAYSLGYLTPKQYKDSFALPVV